MTSWIERVLLRWLAAVAPPDWSDTVLGDVREDAGARTATPGLKARGSGFSGRLWTNCQLASIATRLSLEALFSRRAGRSRIIAALVTDVRYATRVLRRAPAFSAIAIVTLAVAIGANTAIYSALRLLVLDPLAFKDGDRFVLIWYKNASMGGVLVTAPMKAAANWRGAGNVFDAVETYTGQTLVLTGEGEPQEFQASFVRPAMLTMLGVPPVVGRPLLESDTAPGAPPVVLISHAVWSNRFGRDPNVTSRRITLSDVNYQVVGVMPRRFELPMGSGALWIPAKRDQAGDRGQSTLAKLRAGVTIADAQKVVESISAAQTDPDLKGWSGVLMPAGDRNGSQIKSALYVLSGAVGLLLLIACVNVANLMFSRHTGRQREMAVRSALGASRGRLVRQLLVESLVVAIAGGAAGLGIAELGIEAMVAMRPANLDVLERVYLDGPTIAFAAIASMLTAILVGVAPAVTASRVRLQAMLGAGSRSVTASGLRVRSVLTAAQVAIALILLVGASLLIRSYLRLSAVDPGFDPSGVLSVRISLPADRYPVKQKERREGFFNDALTAVRALPGVTSAAIGNGVPPDSGIMFGTLDVQGDAAPAKMEVFAGGYVSPAYFQALRIPVLEGRVFSDEDGAGRDPVAVVGKSLAEMRRPHQSPIGAHVKFPSVTGWATVVGVVADVKALGLADSMGVRQLYFPRAQTQPGFGAVIVRATGDPAALVPAIKSRIWALDPQLPIRDVATATQLVARSTSQSRFNLALLAAFAGCGLALAVVGVYGVMALSVGQRRQELGIRMALGATRGAIVSLMLRHATAMVLAGVVVGGIGAALLSHFMSSLLFATPPGDLMSFAAGALALTIAALAAVLMPVRRAAAVNPTTVLRSDGLG